ncbi:AraC family transcriptional regulator [Sphingobacterium tabacisoli]|uniref:Helix-turn-helix domain-containing protein n=1 Tax=Sphingobacterium tabacisoli TaxID=2044855 RepID=A0ABW5KZE6_9SPHI|nr:helix-turn-helix domain-containing protein [Sphingobacterium tabacisoli]
MSHRELSHLWKEAVVSRRSPRDIAKTMHLSIFSKGMLSSPAEGIYMIQSRMDDILIMEVKGRSGALYAVDLPQTGNEVLWLCIQLQGKTVFPNGANHHADRLMSFMAHSEGYTPTLAAERQWVLFFGLTGHSRLQLLAELPALRQAYDEQPNNTLQSISISYLERQIIEGLCKKALGPFNALYQSGVAIGKLFNNYTIQLMQPRVPSKEEAQIQIYHRALAYVRKHYLVNDLTSEKIADVLGCSVRNLTRAFEGRSLGVKATIIAVRLYKARELLKSQSDLSIADIAEMLHFPDAKHFAVQYKKCFCRTPREERKTGTVWIKDNLRKRK